MARRRRLSWLGGALLGLLLAGGCAPTARPKPVGLLAGQEAQGPWWMRQTGLSRRGELYLKDKPWWPRAAGLATGEWFSIDNRGELGAPVTLGIVRRERVTRVSGAVEALVWIIDDDGDGAGDTDSDCYVVDYGADGVVDRMVDYIDDDGDNEADEMDIRYFVDGELRYAWMGMDLDDDGVMWDVVGYEYSGNFFRSDPYGNSLIFMNKFNPRRGTWAPISECPFAFYDTDGDGFSEVVVRVSAVPMKYNTDTDPDYANAQNRFEGIWSNDLEEIGIVNIRYGFDVDNLSGPDTPLHYDFGFNLVGSLPYDFPDMYHLNSKRRPPQVVCVIPHGNLRAICDSFPAEQTGFSWHEYEDDTEVLGDGPRAAADRRWEGVFWLWERRFMGNTGGPTQRWNIRREWTGKPADRRELYYSGVDRRIHLFGAEEGWIPIGHFAGQKAWGEVRMFDTDGNGYFDRWEVYIGESPVPVRVSTVRDEKARRISFNDEDLHKFYTRQLVPEALATNEKFMAAMARLRAFAPPPALAAALNHGSPGERRYVQEVIREMQYQELRQSLTARAHLALRDARRDDLWYLRHGTPKNGLDSSEAWRLIRALEKLDVAYGQGDLDTACAVLEDITSLDAAAK